MTRLIAALTLALMATPASAASRLHRARTVCITYHDPGAGPVPICGLPIRRR